MKHIYFFTAIILCVSCKTNRIVNGEREGLWIEKNEIGDITYKSRGRYRNGFEYKAWKYRENGQLVRKEVYRDSICDVTHFRNKKKSLEGQTKLRVTDTLIHWFYIGDWTEFDSRGQATAIRTYNNGELVKEVEQAPN